MKRALLVLALLIAPAASAQLTISLTSDRATARTGERFTATIVVRNAGAVAADQLRLQFGYVRGTLVFDLASAPGWACVQPPTDSVYCTASTLAAGAEATFRVTLLTPISTEEPIRASASVFWMTRGQQQGQSTLAELAMPVTPATRRADLAGEASGDRSAREGQTADITVNVRNNGPDAAGPLWLIVYSGIPHVRVIGGDGWSCEGLLCSRASLAAGANAPVALRVDTPNEPVTLAFSTFVIGENIHDPLLQNNYTSILLSVGNAERYEKVLLPLTPGTIYGVNSVWTVTMSMLIDSTTRIELFPLFCFICINEPLPPLNLPIDPSRFRLVPSSASNAGFFLYTHRGDAAKLRFNIRAQDVSRAAQSWGTEIPVVREGDVRTDRIALMDVPVGDTFRHTIRVYDFDGTAGAQVAINVHGINGGPPIATFTRTLITREDVITAARLPQYPAYVGFDSHELPSLPLSERIWYTITPLTPGLRIWAYATVTNNVTQHVTTVTPQ